MARTIELTQGYVALVDESDYQRVIEAGPWHASKDKCTVYALHTIDGKKALRLHSFILGTAGVDHKNGNGLDCRRRNLRKATSQQNAYNRRVSTNNTSGYKGVYWHKGAKKWVAQINKQGKRVYIGSFSTAEAAANAYDKIATLYYGEFALTNEKLRGTA